MLQAGLIPAAHHDLVTDAAYDFYGQRLATCSLDQRIKIWHLDDSTGTWKVEDEWKAHDAAISKLAWAHPEFGTIIASCSFDRTVKIWEQLSPGGQQDVNVSSGTATGIVPTQGQQAGSTPRWVERAVLHDARGTVRAVEFAPHRLGLKLAAISSDNTLRIYECLEQPSLTTWQLSEEVDISSLPASISPALQSHLLSAALATPTHASAHSPLDPAGANMVAHALQQNLNQGALGSNRPGLGSREADGGWCISWCKEHYWGEILAVGSGVTGIVKVVHISPSRRPSTLLSLDPPPLASQPTNTTTQNPTDESAPKDALYAITSVAWAPSCGRSYHLIATGGRDGKVRIWKVKPSENAELDEPLEADEIKWSATVVADFDTHKSAVTRVEWNITGTVLSSVGNDGRVRLWKATSGNVWRPAGSIGVEQGVEGDQDAGGDEGRNNNNRDDQNDLGDVEMES